MSADTLFWSLATLLTLAGLALAAWALFADRSRGRRRCPRCWYDMSATEGVRCPECGREAKRERKFFKTRRRWRWMWAAAALFLAAAFTAVQPKVQRDGWASVTPTSLLILLLQTDYAAESLDEIESRSRIDPANNPYPWPVSPAAPGADRASLFDWQWAAIADRCFAIASRDDAPLTLRMGSLRMLVDSAPVLSDKPQGERVRDHLLALLDEPNLQRDAIRGLLPWRNSPDVVASVMGLLDDPAPLVRTASIRLLMISRAGVPTEKLRALLNDPDPVVSTAALEALHRINARTMTPAQLYEELLNPASISFELRSVALRLALELETERDRALKWLEQDALTDNARLRFCALTVMSLLDFQPSFLADAVFRALQDADPYLRASGVYLLQRLSEQELRERRDQLEALVANPDAAVANAAKEHLSRIDNEDSASSGEATH